MAKNEPKKNDPKWSEVAKKKVAKIPKRDQKRPKMAKCSQMAKNVYNAMNFKRWL